MTDYDKAERVLRPYKVNIPSSVAAAWTNVDELIGTDDSGVNNKTTSMTDTSENFTTLGVAEGMLIENTTDGSMGWITSISTTTNPNDTINFSDELAGGTDNDFDNGDTFRIYKNKGWLNIEAVYYSNTTNTEYLELRDVDNHSCYKFIADGSAAIIDLLEEPITVELPLDYYDSDAGGANVIRIWGTYALYKLKEVQ